MLIHAGSQSNKVIFSSDLTIASHAQEGKLGTSPFLASFPDCRNDHLVSTVMCMHLI